MVRQRTGELAVFRELLGWMSRVTAPRVDAVVRSHPEAAAEGFARARFLQEAKQYVNVLGGLPADETRVLLEKLAGADQLLLAAFARRRLTGTEAQGHRGTE